MPYVKEERRDALDNGATPTNAGELNYRLTRLAFNDPPELDPLLGAVDEYLDSKKRKDYAVYNEVIGAITCALMERRRRLPASTVPDPGERLLSALAQVVYDRSVVPYEDIKIKDNGDIPEYIQEG